MKINKGIISVAGGKGGTGKTFFTTNIGISLAVLGYKVILIDGDFGGPNLHNFLSIDKPEASLTDLFLNGRKPLEEIIVNTNIDNLKLIACGSAVFGMANLHYSKKLSLMNKIKKLDFDYTFIDLGSGTGFNTLDFFNLSNEGIVVINPNPVSRQDSLVFLKSALFRKIIQTIKEEKELFEKIKININQDKRKAFNINIILKWIIDNSEEMVSKLRKLLIEYKPKFLFNKITKDSQVNVSQLIINSVRKYLKIDIEFLGGVQFDQNVEKSTEEQKRFILNYPKSDASQDIFNICSNFFHSDSISYSDFIKLLK